MTYCLPVDPNTLPTNGHEPQPEAPHPGGAFAVNGAGLPAAAGGAAAAPRTIFLPEVRPTTLRLALYALGRAELAGARLWRWVWLGGVLLALIWLPGRLPGGYWVSAALLPAVIALALLRLHLGRTDFVAFDEEALPPVAPAPLPSAAKLPVYTAGRLGVETKVRRFTWLPGFYRTFATREHALLCHCTPRRVLGIGAWPEDEAGLWYAFFEPGAIRQVRWGTADVGGARRRTLAVTIDAPPASEKRLARGGPETLYVACVEEEQAAAILADLLHDARVPAGVP